MWVGKINIQKALEAVWQFGKYQTASKPFSRLATALVDAEIGAVGMKGGLP
ncbi:MAG: hypothetical protein H7834_12975 [Magnetococcus sp. YQC-9]